MARGGHTRDRVKEATAAAPRPYSPYARLTPLREGGGSRAEDNTKGTAGYNSRRRRKGENSVGEENAVDPHKGRPVD